MREKPLSPNISENNSSSASEISPREYLSNNSFQLLLAHFIDCTAIVKLIAIAPIFPSLVCKSPFIPPVFKAFVALVSDVCKMLVNDFFKADATDTSFPTTNQPAITVVIADTIPSGSDASADTAILIAAHKAFTISKPAFTKISPQEIEPIN